MNNLIERRIAALFHMNSQGQLIGVNEPDTNQDTPRFYLLRTVDRIAWRVRHDLLQTISNQIEKLVATEPHSIDFQQALQHHVLYVALLEQDAPVNKINSGPAYILPESSPSDTAISITAENSYLLEKHFAWTLEIFDFRSPVAVCVEDDTAVAACFSARKTEYIAEAGVFTIEDYRKKGYAKAVVRNWSIAVREMGILPVYSTSQNNIASQSVAKNLGAIPYATDFSYF